MSRQRASCLISEEFVGCPQAWAAGRAKHGGGGGLSPPPPPFCGLASFACPQKTHSRGICPVGPHARPGILAPILSKESQGLCGQHVTQLPC